MAHPGSLPPPALAPLPPERAAHAGPGAATAQAAPGLDKAAAPAAHRSAWIWPLLVVVAAVLGSLASLNAPVLYAQLDKPAWAPPAALFGPVWTLLYGLMAVAAWQVARSQHPQRRLALGVFAAQLVANALWSYLFFGAQRGALALLDLLLLLALLVLSAVLFGRIRRSAGWMLVPTIAWVSFAGLLNTSVWLRNPALLGG